MRLGRQGSHLEQAMQKARRTDWSECPDQAPARDSRSNAQQDCAKV